MRVLESAVERRLVRGLAAVDPRIRVLKLTPRGVAGYQDRLVLLPGGTPVFAELKRPGERLRKLQQHRREEVERLGFVVVVADTPERVDALLGLARHVAAGGSL